MSDPVAEAAAQIAEQHADVIPQESAQEAGTAEAGETSAAPVEAAPADISATTSVAAVGLDATQDAAELPNVASVADDHTAAQDSAPNAAGANTTSPTAASSAEPPLHMRIAMHLEAIYTMAREHVEAGARPSPGASLLKAHIGDVLHRISNGMSVAEGELVQKLEALYRVL